jgi:hypothetical protein
VNIRRDIERCGIRNSRRHLVLRHEQAAPDNSTVQTH